MGQPGQGLLRPPHLVGRTSLTLSDWSDMLFLLSSEMLGLENLPLEALPSSCWFLPGPSTREAGASLEAGPRPRLN